MDAKGRLLINLEPRPQTLHVAQDRTVLALNPQGWIVTPDNGLFVHETRMCSRHRVLIEGNEPEMNTVSNVKQHSWMGYYVAFPPGIKALAKDEGSGMMTDVSEQTLELRVSRYVATGVHEDLDLTNCTQQTTRFTLTLEIDADFADLSEQLPRKHNGKIKRQWRSNHTGGWELDFDYTAKHRYDHQGNKGVASVHRGMTVEFLNYDSEPRQEGHRIVFSVTLGPHAKWHTCINWAPRIEDEQFKPQYKCSSFWGENSRYDRLRNIFLAEATRFETEGQEDLRHVVSSTLEQAKEDLISLRLHDLDRGDRAWTMAAGLPIYVSLFGRDTLTASWEAALCGPEMMRGTLPVIAELQGKVENDWRDEQPGRMIHEAHTGPLASLQFNPRQRYYGATTTSAFFPVIVSEFWHWTGDIEMMQQLLPATLRVFKWLERYGDLNGDGFFDYQSRSEQGQKNQAWKDSDSAIVDAAGRQVETPIATCEEQGFVYAAKFQFAEILWWMGKKDEAKRLFHEAGELKKRFEDAFWIDEQRYVALALGKNAVADAIASNAGHCLSTGIVSQDNAQLIADRMLAADMFTGWGIRTLSCDNPAFNPYSYHRGSVWPVEHGAFALGFMRYGLIPHLHKLCRGMFDAASLFDFNRLPECFSGHQRDDEHPFPALYPKANWPQAWSASAMICLLQAILGLYPYAPLKLLLLDPQLPEWLPEITLRQLRVGQASIDIRFSRSDNGRSNFEVLNKRGHLKVLRQPSPWSIEAGWGERLRDLAESIAS
jgi:glycogen debranching enzyme